LIDPGERIDADLPESSVYGQTAAYSSSRTPLAVAREDRSAVDHGGGSTGDVCR
jgi:hypothetical protein